MARTSRAAVRSLNVEVRFKKTTGREQRRQSWFDTSFLQRILVPIDFSECSAAALRCAVELTQISHSKLILLHVIEPPITGSFPFDVAQVAGGFGMRGAREEMLRVVQSTIPPGLEHVELVRTGAPAHAILKLAKIRQVSLIVIGSHCRAGLRRFALGSVAEEVLRKAACPVLIVPAASSERA